MGAVQYWLIIKDLNGKGSDSKTEIMSWSSTSYGSGTAVGGGGGGPGKVDISDISVLKEVDEISSKLMFACASGQVLSKVTIVAERAIGDDHRQFMTVEMSNVMISSFSTSGSRGGSLKATDQVKFSYEKIEFKYSVANDQPNATARPDKP